MIPCLAFGQPGWLEILLVLLIALLLFGSKKLPALARALGKSLSEFKRGKDEVVRELTQSTEQDKEKEEEKTPPA
ncbi:MAG: twin-arginine translocase TatA/TatE family subunit [Kiritimatiellae bacterium]|nr:twin-arginine translocase TatA/TatE family subunit [Kiritimatiellia bacterium]